MTHHDRTLQQRFGDARIVRCIACNSFNFTMEVYGSCYTSVKDVWVPYPARRLVRAIPEPRLVEACRI